jgi:hypothetical protein
VFQLSRAHVRGLGPADARLDPLPLDFRDRDGRPAPTVLWLANGGGKTTLLRLLFHVVRFGEARTIGKADARAQAALGGALGRDDVGHVLLEWRWTGPPRQLAGGDDVLLTGLVCSWRRGRFGGGTGDIARHWYALRTASDDPFDELVAAQTADGTRTTHEDYGKLLRRRARERANEPIAVYDHLGDWETHLGRIGLDSELFGTQVRMNHGEGGADEMLARIRTPGDLVAFLLRSITPAEALEGVDEQLDGYAEKLAERPLLEREATFVDELRAATERLRGAADEHRAARVAVDEARAAGRRVGGAARAAARARRERADALGARRRGWQEDSARHDNRRRDAARRAAGLELWLARHDAALAREVVQETAAQAATSRAEADAWRAVSPLARREVARDRARTLRAQLDAADAAALPWRRAVRRALEELLGRLDAVLAEDRAALSRIEEERRAAREEATAAEARRDEASAEYQHAAVRRGEVEAALRTIEDELSVARDDQLLQPGEEPETAQRRYEALGEDARRRGSRAQDQRDEAREDADEADQRRAAAERELDLVAAERERRTAQHAELEAERTALTASERLLEVLEVDAIDLDLAGDDGVAALRSAADRDERRLIDLAAAGTEDERRLRHVTETGLLPADEDVATVAATLRAHGHDAATGAEHLARRYDAATREQLLADDPGFADAVVVDARPASGAHHEGPMRAVPLRRIDERVTHDAVSGHPGTWDREAAAAWATDAEAREQDRRRRDGELRQRARETRALADRLEQHLRRWGPEPRATAQSELDELGRRHDEATTSRDRAQRQAASAREAEQQAIATERGATQASASASAAARAAERLVRRVAPLAGLREERTALLAQVEDARARADEAAVAAQAARGRDGQLEQQTTAVRTRIDRRGVVRDQRAPRLAALEAEEAESADDPAAADDGPAAVSEDATSAEPVRHEAREPAAPTRSPDPGQAPSSEPIGLDVLEERVEAAERELQRRTPPGETRRALDDVERQASEADAELPGDAEIVQRAAELLGTPAGADVDARRRAEAAAHQRADVDARAAERALNALQRADDEADRLAAVADLVTPDPPPADAGAGRAALATARREQEDATSAARDVEARLRETADDFADHDRAATRLAEAAKALPEPEPGDPDPDPDLVTALGDAEVVHARRSAAQREIETAQEVVDVAIERRDAAVRAVHDVLVADRHDGVAEQIRRELRGAGSDALVDRSASLVEELGRRAEMITDRLVTLDQDRQVVAATLSREVDGAVRSLRRIQRQSALPEGLGEWTGKATVTFGGLELPKDPGALKALVGGVVERLVTAEKRPRGVDLLVRAVLEALDQSRLSARILKPTGGEPGDPQPVDQLPTFSGGQRATVAILLYATFARVRREGLQRRGRDAGVGTLFLDNPLGKANAQFLVDRQLAVARAAGIQLVYTTGIGDFDALDRFPVVIRLRNRGVVGRAIRRVLPEEEARPVVGDGGGLEGVRQHRELE